MAVRWLPLALLPVLGGQAQAGAWERAAGTSFLSLGYSLPWDVAADEGTGSVYLEHGLGWRLTAGMKLDQRQVAPHELAFFLRRNVNAPDAALQVALEVGLSFAIDGRFDDLWRQLRGEPVPAPAPEPWCGGGVEITPGFERILPADLATGLCYEHDAASDDLVTLAPGQPLVALNLGRGFGVPFGVAGLQPEGGWWDLRLGLVLPRDGAGQRFEADALVGLSLTPRSFVTLELWHDADDAGTFTSVVPGLGRRLRDRYAVTLRVAQPLGSDLAASLELATWVEF